jgi:hypothetical protein
MYCPAIFGFTKFGVSCAPRMSTADIIRTALERRNGIGVTPTEAFCFLIARR